MTQTSWPIARDQGVDILITDRLGKIAEAIKPLTGSVGRKETT